MQLSEVLNKDIVFFFFLNQVLEDNLEGRSALNLVSPQEGRI